MSDVLSRSDHWRRLAASILIPCQQVDNDNGSDFVHTATKLRAGPRDSDEIEVVLHAPLIVTA